MIDLTEMNIMFTLNGEMLISDSGSEMAFKDVEIGEGKHGCFQVEKLGLWICFYERYKIKHVLNIFRFHTCVQSGPVPNWQD